MAVDYREVNLQLETTANQPVLFQCSGAQTYFAKVDNLWGYHQLKVAEKSSKVTAIITPWGFIGMVNYFRAFFQEQSYHMIPLTALTKKKSASGPFRMSYEGRVNLFKFI